MSAVKVVGKVVRWTALLLWEVGKVVVAAVVLIVAVVLVMVGVLAHFVGGPPR
jgi:hypothetical protein